VHQEAEDLVAGRVAGDACADLLDHARVVPAERDGVLVLDAHLGEHPGGDAVVDRVGGRGQNPHEHLARARSRGGKVVAGDRRRAGFLERDGLHVRALLQVGGRHT
jgi:hypothetical protein